MPSPTYEQNKKHIYKYRENNLEKFKAIVNKASKKYYHNNKEQRKDYNIKYYQIKKEFSIYRFPYFENDFF